MGKHHAHKDRRPAAVLGGMAVLVLTVATPTYIVETVPAEPAVGSVRPLLQLAPVAAGGQVSASFSGPTQPPKHKPTARPRPAGSPSAPGRGLLLSPHPDATHRPSATPSLKPTARPVPTHTTAPPSPPSVAAPVAPVPSASKSPQPTHTRCWSW